MAGLQTIVNSCNQIDINRRNVVGIQYSRNEIPRVTMTPTMNPWKISLTMPNSLRYSEARAVMEAIDTLDRIYTEVITFSNNPKLSWIFAYQGEMTLGQRNALRIISWVGETMILDTLPSVSSGTILFEPNDLIQVSGYAYPTTVRDRVVRGSGTTVSLHMGRPNIIGEAVVVGSPIVVGNACSFAMFCPNMPTYSLMPGGYLGSRTTTTNNALIQWSDKFQLYEAVNFI